MLVVGISVVIMKISFQRLSGFGLRIPCFRPALLLKAIAVVPTSSVFGPDTHAHPAEFMATFTACHMIAPAVLLNGRMTLGALFCISGNPVGRLRVILALLEPLLNQCTRSGLVVVERATKTEKVTAFAVYCRYDTHEFLVFDAALDGVYTVGGGAPS